MRLPIRSAADLDRTASSSPAEPPGAPEDAQPGDPMGGPPEPPAPTPDRTANRPPGVPAVAPEDRLPDASEGSKASEDFDPGPSPGAPLSPPYRTPGPPEDNDTPSDWFAPYDTASLPPDHPAYNRVQARRSGVRRGQLVSLFAGVAIVLVGLLVTYLLLRPGAGEGTALDLLTVVAAHADAATIDVTTSDLDEAEEYIIGEFGWPIRVPVLPEARLVGAGIDVLAEGVEVPVLRYARDDGSAITVYVYDYAFLDAASGVLTLSQPVYARLAEEPPVDVRRVGEAYLILWRRRAAIYTAVTYDDPAPLVEYLRRR